jgi:hypothetical protein
MATKLPTFDRLMNPLLRAVRALGGSGSVEEIYDKVVEVEKLREDDMELLLLRESGFTQVEAAKTGKYGGDECGATSLTQGSARAESVLILLARSQLTSI